MQNFTDEKFLLQLKESLEDTIQVKEARKSFKKFCEYCFNIKLGKIHIEWHNLATQAIQEKQPCVIFAPRGHGKTTIMSVARALFLIGHNPDLRIKIVSHSDKKASDILRQIKEAIEFNEKYQKVFPHVKPGLVWASNKILVTRELWSKDVTIEALGILSGATGGRCDYIIFDDVVEFNNAIKYPALIKMVKEAFYNNWLNLLEPTGYSWCLIGTIWTQMDLHWELYQKPFTYKKIYRIDLDTLEPIWPEYWTKEKLVERYNSMPLRAFARAFANMPISREDAVFNKEQIEKCIVYNDPKHYLQKCSYVIMGVDLAISQKKKSANTAIFIMGILEKRNETKLVALHCEYGKWSSPETITAILKLYKDWNVDAIVVENNQYQEALIQWLEEFNQSLPVYSHYTTSEKHDPEIGLPSMALEFEKQKWIIPVGKLPHDSDCKCGKCKWIDELLMYPFGETSDILMASYFARNFWRKNKNINSNVIVESW